MKIEENDIKISNSHKDVMIQMNEIAEKRDAYIRKNKFYYNNLLNFLKFNISNTESSVLEIGCGTGYLLNELNAKKSVGIDFSEEMIAIAKSNYSNIEFHVMNAENITLNEKFDYIVISDTIGYFDDIQNVFNSLQKVCHSDTRIIINYINFLWRPLLNIAEIFSMKMPQKKNNWLDIKDINNLLEISNFQTIKTGRFLLIPFYFPIISWFVNKYLAHLPLIRNICLSKYLIARSVIDNKPHNLDLSVSVIIPARNEKGNIENAIKRMPKMGSYTEIIFIEGNSTDNTLEEIKRVCAKYSDKWDLKYDVQTGKGKGDAVRKGFDIAKGDVLMILDADLTVPPEDLPKFYNALASGKGEYINGTRLVYPMEDEAMRTLNMMGNHFFAICFSWLLNQRIKDTLCGTKVLTKKNYEKIISNRSYFGDFDPFGDFDLIFGSAKLNLKFIEIPIRYKARSYGETNISRFKHGFLLLKMTLFAMSKIKFI